MKVTVVLTTYNQPQWLEKVLWGYAVQSVRGFQVVIADDGSGPDTAAMIECMRADTGMELVHVWHPDRGFRKSEILNRAIVAAGGDYLIFSDGDCIPRNDFVATHVRLAEPDRFLSGGALRLGREVSERISKEDILSGRFADREWLRAQGYRPGWRALRLTRAPWLANLLDRLTTTRPTWNGGNASVRREAIFAVNGFDMEMRYGGQDRAFGERLEHLGVRGKQVRHRTLLLHLDHGRPYRTEEALRRNQEIRKRIAKNREVRARVGIAELKDENDG